MHHSIASRNKSSPEGVLVQLLPSATPGVPHQAWCLRHPRMTRHPPGLTSGTHGWQGYACRNTNITTQQRQQQRVAVCKLDSSNPISQQY